MTELFKRLLEMNWSQRREFLATLQPLINEAGVKAPYTEYDDSLESPDYTHGDNEIYSDADKLSAVLDKQFKRKGDGVNVKGGRRQWKANGFSFSIEVGSTGRVNKISIYVN